MSNRSIKTFTLYYQNVRGLCSKTDTVFSAFPTIGADAVFLTESWLKPEICDAELFDTNLYNVFRKDRDFGSVGRLNGGGVVTIIDSNFCSLSFSNVISANLVPLIDTVICKCSFDSYLLYLVNIYIPPDVSCDDYELFLEALSLDLAGKNVIIVVTLTVQTLMLLVAMIANVLFYLILCTL